ncbi:MAG: hypothetical protein LQ346_006615, partial [Caloplaca aetnensis]
IRQPVVVTHTAAARKSHAAPVYGKGPLRRSEVVGYAHAMNGVGFHPPQQQQQKARKAVDSGLSRQEAMMFAQANNYHPLKRGQEMGFSTRPLMPLPVRTR